MAGTLYLVPTPIGNLGDISQRMAVAWQLDDKVSTAKIAEATGASPATISRVNRCYQYGAGGYTAVLKKLKEEET